MTLPAVLGNLHLVVGYFTPHLGLVCETSPKNSSYMVLLGDENTDPCPLFKQDLLITGPEEWAE